MTTLARELFAYMGAEMETLVIGNCIMRKDAQDESLAEDYRNKFQED